MRNMFGLAQDTDPGVETGAPTTDTREIPYDYVAHFTLSGNPGNRVQDVINISVDGTFVATAIGYSFIPALIEVPTTVADPTIGTALLDWAVAVLSGQTDSDGNALAFSDYAAPILRSLVQRFVGIDFKYSIIDSGEGRLLGNLPIHNVAGLGEPEGRRPFRPFAKPMLFAPRSTIRIEVEEISEGPFYNQAELFLVLHGLKRLGDEMTS